MFRGICWHGSSTQDPPILATVSGPSNQPSRSSTKGPSEDTEFGRENGKHTLSTHPKTKMIIEKQPFQNVSTINNGEFQASHISFQKRIHYGYQNEKHVQLICFLSQTLSCLSKPCPSCSTATAKELIIQIRSTTGMTLLQFLWRATVVLLVPRSFKNMMMMDEG